MLTSASAYIVEVSPTSADRTNVTGTASLAGTVQAVFGPGAYITRTYTILSAAGGSTGTVQQPHHDRPPGRLHREPELHRDRRDPEPHRDAGPAADRHRRPEHQPAQRRHLAQHLLQQRRHAAAGLRQRLRPHRRQSRQCAEPALGRGRHRRPAGRVPDDQPVPRADARSLRRRPHRRRPGRRARARLRARARSRPQRSRPCLCRGAQGAAG